MSKVDKFTADADAWDSGELGSDAQYAKRAKPSASRALDEAFELQMISVRLQKNLIEDLKFIAHAHGIGYQPLIRDILTRFASAEKMSIMRDILEQRRLENDLREQGCSDDPSSFDEPDNRKVA